MDGGRGKPPCLPLDLTNQEVSSHRPSAQGSCSLGAVNTGEQIYTVPHTYPRQGTRTHLAPWGRTNSHKDIFVPRGSHVKSQHGSQGRWNETEGHFLTPHTVPSPSAHMPGLLGSPPGGVLQTRRLLFSPPLPDGQTETQTDVKDLPNPTAWLAEAPKLIRHSPTIPWAFRLW